MNIHPKGAIIKCTFCAGADSALRAVLGDAQIRILRMAVRAFMELVWCWLPNTNRVS